MVRCKWVTTNSSSVSLDSGSFIGIGAFVCVAQLGFRNAGKFGGPSFDEDSGCYVARDVVSCFHSQLNEFGQCGWG